MSLLKRLPRGRTLGVVGAVGALVAASRSASPSASPSPSRSTSASPQPGGTPLAVNGQLRVARAARLLPLFVTEFGTVSATGGGALDLGSTGTWLDLLDQNKISYANWTYSDANESSAAFRPGTCSAGSYTNPSSLSESGAYVRGRIRTADNFPTG